MGPHDPHEIHERWVRAWRGGLAALAVCLIFWAIIIALVLA